ncbi:DUF2390 domain-containing protein [Aliikangiella sp. IMCC44632]
MSNANEIAITAECFWRQSCWFYSNKRAKDLLLNLQNQAGLNVNELLFTIWLAQFIKQPASCAELTLICRESRPIKRKIHKIRQWRNIDWLKQNHSSRLKASIRQWLLHKELRLEQRHQKQLVKAYRARQKTSTANFKANSSDVFNRFASQNLANLTQQNSHIAEFNQLILLWSDKFYPTTVKKESSNY